MIRITHKKLDQIALTYYRNIDKRIKNRILSMEDVLQSINQQNGKRVVDYSTLGSVKWGTVRKLLNALPGVYVADQTKLATLTKPAQLTANEKLVQDIIAYLKVKKNRKAIILSPAKDHEQTIIDHYLKMGITTANEKIIAPLLRRILDYKLITKKIAYNLTWGLNIRTCPYCNRIWIDTVKNKNGGILRPALDHFYSQKKYPLLGLCFYNLVPSCTNCNTSLKNAKDFKVSTHIHPYIEGFRSDAFFSFNFKKLKKDISHPDNFTLEIAKGKQITTDKALRVFGDGTKDIGSVPTFKLDDTYQVHKDLLGELYVKSDENSPFYLTSIKDFLVQLGTSKEEFYRYHFHNLYEEELMNMRPLSKFTKDIVLERVPELR
ncbi:MAG: hypothetical protein HY062_01810 [Bacteroidetes bacterium]|nr:hypothetical protein [Bacteroidota bacterium]